MFEFAVVEDEDDVETLMSKAAEDSSFVFSLQDITRSKKYTFCNLSKKRFHFERFKRKLKLI